MIAKSGLQKSAKGFVSTFAVIGVLAGVGLASSPAQAGTFTFDPDGDGVFTQDTEWGSTGPEPIWATFPSSTTAPTTPPGSIPGTHGIQGVDGYDNPLISHSGGGKFKIEYFGSGTARKTNDFLWNGKSLFGPKTGLTDGCADPNNFGTVCASTVVDSVEGVLPFAFTTTPPPDTISNGDSYSTSNPQPHYFATIDGTYATSGKKVLYLGLSDRGANDDDAADYVVKVTQVPEPTSILGLLAVGSLGAAIKRKKQQPERV